MSLPPLPANLLPRYKLRYAVAGLLHSITVHMSTTGTLADAVTNGTALADLLKQICPTNLTFTEIDFCAAGSNVFNLAAALAVVGTAGGTTAPVDTPRALSFVGRNPNGRKIRLFVIGAFSLADANWRIEASESVPVANIIAGLNAGTGDVRCIDGVLPTWKGYANFKWMDHWVKQARRGAG